MLSDRHARAAIDCLRRSDGPVDLADLARRVVAAITDEPPDDVPDDVVRRVRTWLHHGHLPVLHTHGVVEFDPDAGTVSLAERDAPALPDDGPAQPDEDDPPSTAEVTE